MAEIDADPARLALAAIAEADGAEPLADPYREEQALRLATSTDLDLVTARRVVEVTFHATTLSELMVAITVAGARAQVVSTFRQLRRAVEGLAGGDGPPTAGG